MGAGSTAYHIFAKIFAHTDCVCKSLLVNGPDQGRRRAEFWEKRFCSDLLTNKTLVYQTMFLL